MLRNYTLNLTQADTALSIYDKPPLEFPDGGNVYKAESAAAGGARFQHNRLYRCAAYAKDCVPMEAGYSSVVRRLTGSRAINAGSGRLEFATGCQGERDHLLRYCDDAVVGWGLSKQGSIVMMRNGKTWMYNEQGGREAVVFKGLDLTANAPQVVEGFTAFEGHLFVYTSTQLFFSGAEDMLDFVPALRTGAGSFAISADIGAIITVVPFSRGVYVFGKRGAVVGQCTGDIHYPLSFQPVLNHDGIEHKLNVQVDFYADSLLVYSHSGLQRVRNTEANNVYPDASVALRLGKVATVHLPPCFESECEPQTGVTFPHPHTSGDAYEHREQFIADSYSPFYGEVIKPTGKYVAVNNISPRYTTVSYGHDGKFVCGQPTYCRLLVIDNYNERSTILHFWHTDVIRPKHGEYTSEFIIAGVGGDAFDIVRRQGWATLYFHEFRQGSGNPTVMTRLAAHGFFNHEKYPEMLLQGDHLHYATYKERGIVQYAVGLDLMHMSCVDGLFLTNKGVRELQYSGRIRANKFSFPVHFSGDLVSLSFYM